MIFDRSDGKAGVEIHLQATDENENMKGEAQFTVIWNREGVSDRSRAFTKRLKNDQPINGIPGVDV